jgi:hypothetical protein
MPVRLITFQDTSRQIGGCNLYPANVPQTPSRRARASLLLLVKKSQIVSIAFLLKILLRNKSQGSGVDAIP